MARYISRLSGPEYLARLARTSLTKGLSKRRRALFGTKIACFPGDDIGENIIAHGVYEDLLLSGLFDDLLSGMAEGFRSGAIADVGANIGNHSLWFSRRFARVVAFEPNPICVRLFEANMMMNDVTNVQLFPVGLSEAAGQLNFHMDRSGNLGRSGVTSELAAKTDQTFPIEVAAGDGLLTPAVLAGLPLSAVKIDVEGHELAALKGLRQTIVQHKPLVMFESHGATGESGSDRVVDYLSQLGYCHYYVIERRRSPFRAKILKAAYRLLAGQALVVRKVPRPEDKPYSLVLSSTTPLNLRDVE